MKTRTDSARFTRKIFFLLLLLLLNYGMISYLFHTVFETITDDDRSYLWSRLHQDAAEGNYGDVWEQLRLYDLYGEEYDGLWNAAEAYRLYCLYTAASRAASDSPDPELSRKYQEQAEQMLAQLEAVPEDSDDPTANQAVVRIKQRVQ